MSLLIVRCPLKPFANANAAPNAWQDLGCAEHFEWCLIEHMEDADAPTQFGVGTTQSMPYADEALILLPTFDVRLIEAKVPLVNPKKLQQILPNLIEDYVMAGAESLAVQALPPVPGSPTLQRVLALTERTWFNWLTKQLEQILSPRMRLIPDCLVLPLAGDGQIATIVYERIENNFLFTQRTGTQTGASWVELAPHAPLDSHAIGALLPHALAGAPLIAISWDYLVKSCREYLLLNSSSRSVNFALNLLPKNLKRGAKSSGLGAWAGLRSALAGKSDKASAGLGWADPLVWRQPLHWLGYCALVALVGFGLQLSYLLLNYWRWNHQMELLAAQSLTPASIALLNQPESDGVSHAVSNKVLNVFIQQVTNSQRRQGAVVDADFAPMAAKLQQLKAVYGAEVLQKIDYDGYGIDFEFKPGSITVDHQAIIRRARGLGIAVKYLGANRYRLEPYAGLGSDE